MAMTKAEREALANAQHEAALARALRWTDGDFARDVQPPSLGEPTGTTRVGWDFNAYNMRVYRAWTRSGSHGEGAPPSSTTFATDSQNKRALYSTRALAYAAMRSELEREFAGRVLAIDREIAKGEP